MHRAKCLKIKLDFVIRQPGGHSGHIVQPVLSGSDWLLAVLGLGCATDTLEGLRRASRWGRMKRDVHLNSATDSTIVAVQ
jgi:hypothetical protein